MTRRWGWNERRIFSPWKFGLSAKKTRRKPYWKSSSAEIERRKKLLSYSGLLQFLWSLPSKVVPVLMNLFSTKVPVVEAVAVVVTVVVGLTTRSELGCDLHLPLLRICLQDWLSTQQWRYCALKPPTVGRASAKASTEPLLSLVERGIEAPVFLPNFAIFCRRSQSPSHTRTVSASTPPECPCPPLRQLKKPSSRTWWYSAEFLHAEKRHEVGEGQVNPTT